MSASATKKHHSSPGAGTFRFTSFRKEYVTMPILPLPQAISKQTFYKPNLFLYDFTLSFFLTMAFQQYTAASFYCRLKFSTVESQMFSREPIVRRPAAQTMKSIFNLTADTSFEDLHAQRRCGASRIVSRGAEENLEALTHASQTISTFASSSKLVVQTQPINYLTPIAQWDIISMLGTLCTCSTCRANPLTFNCARLVCSTSVHTSNNEGQSLIFSL